jgi:hypothetical protein
MTMTTTNVEILRQGWLDAASALAPGLDTLPEFLEHGLEAAVIDERLDEQSLLKVVAEVTGAAADSLPAEEMYFLTRRLQRAVYEYLLSLDALPEPPPRRDGANGHAAQDATLIGAEEVAALGRSGHAKTAPEPPHVPETVPQPEADLGADTVAAVAADSPPDPIESSSAADRVEAGLAELDAQLSPEEPDDQAPVESPEAETQADAVEPEPEPSADPEPSTRPPFTLFRRTGAAATKADRARPQGNGSASAEPVAAPSNGSNPAEPETAENDSESFVKPKDGFHLSDLADFAVVQRPAPTSDAPDGGAPEGDAVEEFEAVSEPEPDAIPAEAAPNGASGAATRGWRLRDEDTDQAHDLNSESDADDTRFETDPEVIQARLEINDRLRRKRCDEAAALLQRLANDVGGRALAELALDAGDRCRALGKGNAALSCYLAASRADPVHETPLLRLADICIDDHDIDLAVSYLERVTRLRRLRSDDKGALKLYRKIVTIAPYRDDILAMLMRAQTNGRFDE